MGNDAELLETWRSGNQRAGEILLSRYFDSLYRFFASKVDADPEALVERTLQACLERVHDVRDPASFRGYLFTVARHELYDSLRGGEQGQERDATSAVSAKKDAADPSGALMVERQEQRLLLRGLRQLQMDMQILLGLFYWEGLSNAELAGVLSQSEAAVKDGLEHARAELEARMRTLAASRELLRSTVDNLDAWVSSLAAEPK